MNEPFTPELLAQACSAESPEALIALAAEHGVTLTTEGAQERFDQLHQTGEVSDEELENVAGGCGGGGGSSSGAPAPVVPTPKWQNGLLVRRGGYCSDILGCQLHYNGTGGCGYSNNGTARIRSSRLDPSGQLVIYELSCTAQLPDGSECGQPIKVHYDHADYDYTWIEERGVHPAE